MASRPAVRHHALPDGFGDRLAQLADQLWAIQAQATLTDRERGALGRVAAGLEALACFPGTAQRRAGPRRLA